MASGGNGGVEGKGDSRSDSTRIGCGDIVPMSLAAVHLHVGVACEDRNIYVLN